MAWMWNLIGDIAFESYVNSSRNFEANSANVGISENLSFFG